MLLGNSDVLTGAPGARAAGHNPMESPDVPSGVVPPGRSQGSAALLAIGPVPGAPPRHRAGPVASRTDHGRLGPVPGESKPIRPGSGSAISVRASGRVHGR